MRARSTAAVDASRVASDGTAPLERQGADSNGLLILPSTEASFRQPDSRRRSLVVEDEDWNGSGGALEEDEDEEWESESESESDDDSDHDD